MGFRVQTLLLASARGSVLAGTHSLSLGVRCRQGTYSRALGLSAHNPLTEPRATASGLRLLRGLCRAAVTRSARHEVPAVKIAGVDSIRHIDHPACSLLCDLVVLLHLGTDVTVGSVYSEVPGKLCHYLRDRRGGKTLERLDILINFLGWLTVF